jgi:putative membrane protein
MAAIENEKDSNRKPAGPADYLANERTFLAWIRTSIALIGFGFVIVKFAVFIRQVSFMMGTKTAVPQNRYSAFIGLLMVIFGASMAILAYARYRHIEKQLQQNEYFPSKWLSTLVTICIAIASILLVYYLLPNL